MQRRQRSTKESASANATTAFSPPGPEAFVEAAAADGFHLDSAQLAAVDRLADTAARIARREGPAPALYLWGPVGRGKTWLVDVFLRTLPARSARRFHFHAFFRAFHQGLHRHGPGHASVARALDDLIGDANVVCFDELYAHEPGDAKLFTIILRELREQRDLAMVVTSNYPPDGLLPDAEFVSSGASWEEPAVKVRHQAFAEGIALIKRRFEVVPIDGGVDYRTLARQVPAVGFRSGAYLIVNDDGLVEPHARVPVPVASRALGARELRDRDRHVTFTFADLCEQPVGASDIAMLTARFQSWRIENVPTLATCTPEAAQRFVNFIDVLCDADVRLVLTSQHAQRELLQGDRLPPDVARLRSRLTLLPEQPAEG